MSNSIPVVRKLQLDALNSEVSVSSLLRMAKIIATKLDLKDALVWIDRELNGYMDLKVQDLPPYRQLTGEPKAWNPYHGWQPIHFGDPEHARFFSQAPLGQALGAVEESLRDRRDGYFTFPYPHDIKARLMKAINFPTEVQIHLNYGELWDVVDSVRNLILNWSLELEKAGILGEEMTFSAEERKEAGPITQHFFAQNIGVVGNITDQAQVENHQQATVNVTVDVNQVRDFAKQTRDALALLPPEMQTAVEPVLHALEGELAKDTPSQSNVRGFLTSIRTICEGAAGSLTAQGILSMIDKLL